MVEGFALDREFAGNGSEEGGEGTLEDQAVALVQGPQHERGGGRALRAVSPVKRSSIIVNQA